MIRNVRSTFQRMLVSSGRLVLVGEIVTNLPLRQNEFGLVVVALDLLAQTADVHVHRAGVAGVVILPHRVQHLLAGEGTAAVGDEQLQQIELLGGQTDGLVAQGAGALEQIDLQVTHAHDLALLNGGHAVDAAQHRADAGPHLQDVKGLVM